MEGGIYPSDGTFLSGSGTSCPSVWIGVIGHVVGNDKDNGDNDKDNGGNPCRIPKVYHGEEGTEKHRRDVGDTSVWRGVKGGWYVESSHILWNQSGNSGTVGASMPDIQCLCMEAGVRGRGETEETIAATRGARGGSQGHYGRGLMGGAAQTEMT